MYTWPLYYDLFIISVLYIYIIRYERILCTWQMYIYVCIWDVYICVQIDIYIYAIGQHMSLYLCRHVYLHICVYISRVYIDMYIRHIYIYTYIYTYTYISIHSYK